MKDSFSDILYDVKNQVARITINRPQALNAFATKTLEEMLVCVNKAAYDKGVGVLVITGSGERAFSTGGDLKEYYGGFLKEPHLFLRYSNLFYEFLSRIRNCGKPVVARINGDAVAGGNEIQLACDLSIAAEHARIWQAGVKAGSVACAGATQWLPITIGDRRARWLLFTGDPIDAKTALEWGLVNRVVSYAKLDEEVDALCKKLLNTLPECLRYTKTQVNAWRDLGWAMTVSHGQDWLHTHFSSPEPWRSVQAFVEKKPIPYSEIRGQAAEGKATEFFWGAPTESCKSCNASNIPSDFEYCGRCGAKLED